MKKHLSSLLSLALVCSSTMGFAQTPNIYQNYSAQALGIYQRMSLDEKLGQLLMPSYVLLAESVSPQGTLCKNAVNNSQTPNNQLIRDCGLDQIATYHLGSVLTGGGPYYNVPTLENWAQLNAWASKQNKIGNSLDPLLLTGNDAIHGNMHLQGAVIFPHNIGLGVTHDPALLQSIGDLVGKDSLASGFNWIYMPTVAVAQDLRWGRTYESFGKDPALVKTLSQSYIMGFQNIKNNQITGALATAKHFIGDGATQYGFDEGDDAYPGSMRNFWNMNGQGYEGAVEANVGSIMVSYSAINGNNTRMHFGGSENENYSLINQFKLAGGIVGSEGQRYKFNGFMVSDWNGPTRAAYFYNLVNNTSLTLPQTLAKSINAGIDIVMLGEGDNSNPFDPNSRLNFASVGEVFNALKTAYTSGLIKEVRLQEAVTRILCVKLAMKPQALTDSYANLQQQERTVALKAAQESLVLLQNNNQTVPLKRNLIKNVIFVGDTNDLGLQNGGWTVNWQGQKGSQYFKKQDAFTSGATTLEEGVKLALQGMNVNYFKTLDLAKLSSITTSFNPKNTIVIALVSEVPYAEFMGDIGNPNVENEWYKLGALNGDNNYLHWPQSQSLSLAFDPLQTLALQNYRRLGLKIITVVYSGRPVVLSEGGASAPLSNSDVVIAAFLPGTTGGKAIASAIFGDYHFRKNNLNTNTLTFDWPRNRDDVANHFKYGALFPAGYGLIS